MQLCFIVKFLKCEVCAISVAFRDLVISHSKLKLKMKTPQLLYCVLAMAAVAWQIMK